MPFDPSAPIDVLDSPTAGASPGTPPQTFDPTAPVTAEAKQFDPAAPVDPEHPYVTKVNSDPTLSPAEKQSRVDSFNQGLAKFDFDEPVTPIERYGIHAMEAAKETLPALAVKAGTDFMNQPFQATPLPLRLAQAQVDSLQREKDRRAGTLGDVMGDPTYAEYPDVTLDSELAKAKGRVQKFMTPENVAAMTAEKTRLADIQAQSEGEKESYANLPNATGPLQKLAAGAGELAGGLTDPSNMLPLGEAPEGAGLLRRMLNTGKQVAGQAATLEPVRQTLAVGANEPDQTGVGAATQHVASGFAGGMVLQAGSDALGQIVSKFKGVKEADVAGKTVDEAVPIIAAKTGQDPAAVAEQLKPEVPAKATVASGVERPATDTLSLNPEDNAQAFDPDAPVQAEGDAAPDQPKVSFADASGRVETSEDGPQPSAGSEATRIWESPQEGDKYQYTVQRPQPIPGGEGMAPGYTQVDVIRDGDSIQSSTPAQLRSQGHNVPDVPDHVPQGQFSREDIQNAIANPPASGAPLPEVSDAPIEPEPEMTAFHGTPHEVDQFSNEHIGTGEGAAAFGHGLYFAENPNVAASYAARLGKTTEASAYLWPHVVEALHNEDLLGFDSVQDAMSGIKSTPDWQNTWEMSPENKATIQKYLESRGNIYQATLKTSPERMLDWDKPLSQQSAYVKKAIAPILDEARPKFSNLQKDPTGETMYKTLGYDRSALSAKLKQVGIDGIQYLDAKSRFEGKGSRNYVIFDDSKIQNKGLIGGSALKTWADDVVARYSEGTGVNMTGGMDLFAARVVQGAAVLERGITDFAKWSKEMIDQFGEDLKPHLDNLYRVSQELHSEGQAVASSSPDDVKSFLADYRNSDHAAITDGAVKETTPAGRTDGLQSGILREKGEEIGPQLRKVASDVAPKTHALSEDSGVSLVQYAAAKEAAPKIAAAHAAIVLGSHIHDPAFANKLGATLVEDRLQGIKTGLLAQAQKAAAANDPALAKEFFDHAQNVTTMVGKPNSPFKTLADYRASLADPEIQAAITRHKATVQPIAQKQHADLGGRIAQPGLETQAFVNLEALDKDGNPVNGPKAGGTRKGDLTAPRMKGSVNNQRAYGVADNYQTDYNKIAQSMISGNFEETAKRQMYDQLTKDGLAVVMPPSPGQPAPVINGNPARKIEIERRGLPSGGSSHTLVRNLWVDPKIYPEVYKAMNLDETFKNAGLEHTANVANWLQLKGPVNALFHTANLLSSIAGQQGGKDVLTDLVRKIPGVNVVDSLAKITMRARSVVADSTEVRQSIAKLARMGAGRAPFEGAGATSRFLQLIDQAARLVRGDMYDNLVERSWAKDTEQARRDFVNKVGVYNPRLQGQLVSKLKDWGVSPFIVAGQSFNSQALRRVTASPGVTPASTGANLKMRAVELGGLAASLFGIPMAINYALTKQPFGRPGTPLGAIDTGKTDAKGNAIVVDPQQWTGVRRGMRLTGANAVATGVMKGQSSGEMLDNAGRDMIGGFLHPVAGPLVNTAATAATGYNASFYKQAGKAAPGNSQLVQNSIAAAKQLNPLVGNALQGSNPSNKSASTLDALKEGRLSDAAGSIAKGAAKPFMDAAGIKSAAIQTPDDQIKALAGRFTDSLGIVRGGEGEVSPYQDLTKAVHTGDLETASDELDKLIAVKAGQVPGNMVSATKTAIAKREIADYYLRESKASFTGSLPQERAFKSTLNGDQQALYSQAKSDRREAASTVRALLYHQ